MYHEMLGRGLNSKIDPSLGQFSPGQNRAILIVGLACATFSLVAAFVALRWFILMRRSFRHRLVLFLIASDAFKAVWYFVFPIVVFARGGVKSSSSFCQASGFFLLLAIEASDFAILLIALHAILYIFAPISRAGEGGLYPYRKWIVPIWLGPPLLFASLAFVNDGEGYITSGTFCQLPKRPFWYRLALSWIPRYIIVSTILLMYASIYIYVHFKFKDFGDLAVGDDSFASGSATASHQSASFSGSTLEQGIAPERRSIPTIMPPITLGSPSISKPNPDSPWESMSFITARPLQTTIATENTGSAVEDFAKSPASAPDDSPRTAQQNGMLTVNEGDGENATESRKPSEVPTMNTSFTGETAATHQSFSSATRRGNHRPKDPLQKTRNAILLQLRYLFIYPLIYIIMWAFPFAAHALNYNDYYVNHPVFWLIIMQTLMLALQAGVDSIVFSWREKPWRRIDDDSKFSVAFLRRQSKALMGRQSQKNSVAKSEDTTLEEVSAPVSDSKRNSNWWEAEGRKRKDSVWMGTDTVTPIASRQEVNSLTPQRSLERLDEEE